MNMLQSIDCDVEVTQALKENISAITRRVVTFNDNLEIRSDEELKNASQFLSHVVSVAKKLLDDTFDGPIRKITKARLALLEAHKELTANKLAWASPVLTVEAAVKEKMEEYVTRVELANERKEEEGRNEIAGLSSELLSQELQRVVKSYGKDSTEVEEILELMEDDGEQKEEGLFVPLGESKRPELGKGVSIRKLKRYDVRDIGEMRVGYILGVTPDIREAYGDMTLVDLIEHGAVDLRLRILKECVQPNTELIKKEVTKCGKRTESLVGGIEVWFKRSTTVRKAK